MNCSRCHAQPRSATHSYCAACQREYRREFKAKLDAEIHARRAAYQAGPAPALPTWRNDHGIICSCFDCVMRRLG